ncbi:MAG: class I SAM-dependent methyltransferase [Parachlamydia sp.]|nr:class I SAM-dependent methyltransferase [Parachlamydia sp.]
MQPGDFTNLAKMYIHRVGYSQSVLKALAYYTQCDPCKAVIADVGAGTGKLTEGLIDLGFKGYAVEPNEAMREEGMKLIGSLPFAWLNGKGEEVPQPDKSIDWVLMGDSLTFRKRESGV